MEQKDAHERFGSYLAKLPKKRVAAGALIRNDAGLVLIMKPTYRASWVIPGGAVEEEEAPKVGCRRELREELGIEHPVGRLLVVDYNKIPEHPGDSLQCIFDGGIVDAAFVERIVLPEQELSAFRFVAVDAFPQYLLERTALRLAASVTAAENGSTLYLENGHTV